MLLESVPMLPRPLRLLPICARRHPWPGAWHPAAPIDKQLLTHGFTVPDSRQHLRGFLLVHVREPALTPICLRAAPTASRCTMSIRISALQDGFTFLQVLPAMCCLTGFKRVSPRVRAITPARSPDCVQGAQAGIPASDHGKKNWQIKSSRRCQSAPAHTLANELDLQATCH